MPTDDLDREAAREFRSEVLARYTDDAHSPHPDAPLVWDDMRQRWVVVEIDYDTILGLDAAAELRAEVAELGQRLAEPRRPNDTE